MNILLTLATTSLPPPETIRQTARDVVSRPYFELDTVDPTGPTLIERFGEVLRRLLEPVQSAFGNLYQSSPVLAWLLLAALLAVVVALLVHIAYSFRVAMRGRRAPGTFKGSSEATHVEPGYWETQASQAAAQGGYIAGVRYLFQACLLRLEQSRKATVRRGATNRQYLRRYRGTAAFEPLQTFVEMIDAKWYGEGECRPDDFEQCAQAHRQIRQMTQENRDADRA